MPSVAPAIQSLPVEDIYKLTDPQVSNDIKTLWLCKAIITWNIIQHFYPYREDIGDWGNMLDNTISAILAANSDILCKAAYTQMIASLSDGHA
ncbi:hypothetical protein AAEH76_21630, partial [Shewanella algae]|uniref:hypothetical protein n=1 Tax=Shewanella algae TaxID=38313 RepID=UPI00313EA51F